MKIDEIRKPSPKTRVKAEKLLSILEEQAPIALAQYKKGNIIYRGVDASKEVDGRPVPFKANPPKNRKSRNTSNHYTVMVDSILPSWSEYPKRSKSFICSSDWHYAEEVFGDPHAVFPLDNPNIGLCPQMDFWNSFDYALGKLDLGGFSSMDMFNGIFSDIQRLVGSKSDGDNLSDIRKTFKSMDNPEIRDFLQNDRDYTAFVPNKNISFLDFMDKLFSPKTNRFKLYKLSDLKYTRIGKFENSHEVWFSAPAIFVPTNVDEYYNILKSLRKK